MAALLAVLVLGAIAVSPAAAANPTVTCVSTTQCTALETQQGSVRRSYEVTFDPTAPQNARTTYLTTSQTALFQAVACPSATQCTALGFDAGGQSGSPARTATPAGTFAVTFDPTSHASPTAVPFHTTNKVNQYLPLMDIDCPSTTECVAMVGDDAEVTFDPRSSASPTATSISPGDELRAVSCPSVTQCTASGDVLGQGYGGVVVTFAPASPAATIRTPLAASTSDVACPLATQCTTAGGGGEYTFNPGAPGTPQSRAINGGNTNSGFFNVACPSASLCGVLGNVTTYTGAGPTNSTQVAAFDPAAPGTPTATMINSQWQFSGYACASTTQCTAVDNGGNEVTYDPAAPGSLVPVQLAAPPSTVQPPVPAKVLALLSAVGAPSGAAAKIAAILKRGGFTYALRAPGAGTASSSWYAVPVSGRAARASARVLVASGSTRFTKSGRGRLKVKLSRAGRRLLKGARSLRLTSTAAFKPKGHARYVKGSAFTLRR